MPEMTYTERLVVETCWCGINHAIPWTLSRQAHENGKSVYCPLGHKWVVAESVEAKLELERERHRATRDLLAAEEKAHKRTKTTLTRERRRTAAGVCPCCQRTFQQLARHMKAKHPDYGAKS